MYFDYALVIVYLANDKKNHSVELNLNDFTCYKIKRTFDVGSWYLPALFDWSIIGCTILLLALINLERDKKIHLIIGLIIIKVVLKLCKCLQKRPSKEERKKNIKKIEFFFLAEL